MIYKSQIVGAVDCFLRNNQHKRKFSLVTRTCVFLMMGKYLHGTRISAGTCPSPMTHKTQRTKFLLNLCHNGQFFVSGRALEPVHFLAQFGNVKNKLAMVKKKGEKRYLMFGQCLFTRTTFQKWASLTTSYYRLLHLQTGPRPSLRLL